MATEYSKWIGRMTRDSGMSEDGKMNGNDLSI